MPSSLEMLVSLSLDPSLLMPLLSWLLLLPMFVPLSLLQSLDGAGSLADNGLNPKPGAEACC